MEQREEDERGNKRRGIKMKMGEKKGRREWGRGKGVKLGAGDGVYKWGREWWWWWRPVIVTVVEVRKVSPGKVRPGKGVCPGKERRKGKGGGRKGNR